MLQNILPVWGVVISSQVGLELSCQDLECGRLSDTVGTDQTQNLTGSGHGETMQLERVGRVTVSDLLLQVGGQVDNVDSAKGATLHANTATNAEILRDEGNLGGGRHLNTHLA